MDQLDQNLLSGNEKSVKITVKGRVQGVGFRPFVFSLAKEFGIHGTVQNNMDGVKIFAESEEPHQIKAFIEKLAHYPPRLSKITAIYVEKACREHFTDFSIIKSNPAGSSELVIPIDAAVCDDCLAEMENPDDLRYQYPFINCTQCGPRYSIIAELPYDRPKTSMDQFDLCPVCQSEYEDPANRRHHAQPIACPTCGPKVRLFRITGEELENADALKTTREKIKSGYIVAIKGLGGYHLCCNATDKKAVSILRNRKNRPFKPLAVMAASIYKVKEVSSINPEEEKLLKSPEAPIVLVEKKENHILAPNIAPGMKTVGLMLPYTPLHHILLDDDDLPYMVATSANPSGLPILYQDDEAFDYLADIADFVLTHNRPILHPIDDSVVQAFEDHPDIIRRSRGYAPDPIFIKESMIDTVAFGSQMKNTFAIGKGHQVICGPHIGDMNHLEIQEHYQREMNHLLKWTSANKELAVIDMHPSFSTRMFAEDMDFHEVIEVQHHHAHMAGCMEENDIDVACHGIILDGTGYGADGHIWGFEFFFGNKEGFERTGHLHYSPLPGGDKAVKEPWRTAVGMLSHYYGEEGLQMAKAAFPTKTNECELIYQMIIKKINTPLAGTCGRLYDAISAILGICPISSYDSEAAVKLSEAAAVHEDGHYPFMWQKDEEGVYELNIKEMILSIFEDKKKGKEISLIAGKFQWTLVKAVAALMSKKELLKRSADVVLSGGSFHNKYLREAITRELQYLGYNVYSHKQIPSGDGGLAFGQLAVAAKRRGKR